MSGKPAFELGEHLLGLGHLPLLPELLDMREPFLGRLLFEPAPYWWPTLLDVPRHGAPCNRFGRGGLRRRTRRLRLAWRGWGRCHLPRCDRICLRRGRTLFVHPRGGVCTGGDIGLPARSILARVDSSGTEAGLDMRSLGSSAGLPMPAEGFVSSRDSRRGDSGAAAGGCRLPCCASACVACPGGASASSIRRRPSSRVSRSNFSRVPSSRIISMGRSSLTRTTRDTVTTRTAAIETGTCQRRSFGPIERGRAPASRLAAARMAASRCAGGVSPAASR